MKKTEYVAALRELADYIEARNFPDQHTVYNTPVDLFDPPHLRLYTRNKADFGRLCAAMQSFEKTRNSWLTGAETKLPSGTTVSVTANRETVCKRIVVGTRTVAATEERIVEAEPEREEEIVEWECPDSFIALGKSEETES